jgi:hypothetical protein
MVKKGSRRWRRLYGKRKQKSEAKPTIGKTEKLRVEEDACFKREFGFLFSRGFKFAVLACFLALAYVVRIVPTEAVRLGMFQGDDEYWHLHVVNQMLSLGYRPSVDVQAWAPVGRPLVHPPIYHYLIYALARLFSRDAFTVMFNIGPFIAVLACLGWFLLGRKLFNGWIAGLTACGVYAVLPIAVAPTCLGNARPQALAEALMPYAFAMILYGSECRSWKGFAYATVSGLLLGAAVLIWESTIFLYFPLAILYWLVKTATHQANKRFHLNMVLTLTIASIVTAIYYAPVYLDFGVWNNTPAWMLQSTMTFWRPDIGFLLYAQLVGNHVFYVGAIVAFPILILLLLADWKTLPREVWGLTLFSIGFFGGLAGLGMRVIGATLGFGVILTFASVFSKLYRSNVAFPTLKAKTCLAVALCVLVGLSGAYTAYMTAAESVPYYETVSLTGLRGIIGNTVPANSTVICPLGDAAFLLGCGLRTPWDAYLEHLPSWASTHARKVASVFLAQSEEEALRLMGEFNASFILVRVEQTYPDEFALLLEAAGVNGKAEEYFNWTAITELRPKMVKNPATGQWEFFGTFEQVVVGYEWAPQAKGNNTLLARLVFNKDACVLKHTVMPEPPEHFKLVWISQDKTVMLYKVVDGNEG